MPLKSTPIYQSLLVVVLQSDMVVQFEKECEVNTKNQLPSITTATTMTTASSKDEEETIAESTCIDPNEQEIFFATRRDQNADACIEHDKEPAVVVLTLAKAESNLTGKQQQQQQLAMSSSEYRKYRRIIGLSVFMLIVIIVFVETGLGKTKTFICIISPTTQQPTEEQWSLACNFVSITNLTECQSTTSIHRLSSAAGYIIPTEIGFLTQLTYLDLSENQLIGTIPSTLGLLTQLTDLNLHTNQLTGLIPSTLELLTQLASLNLEDNQLIGTVPSTLCSNSGISIYIDCYEIACTCCESYNGDNSGTSSCTSN